MSTTIHAPADHNGTSGFLTPFRIELAANGLWVLLEDLVWVGSNGDKLIVKADEETDFASVPRFAQILLPSADPRVVRAAAVHDFLCREINDYHAAMRRYQAAVDSLPGSMWPDRPVKPAFSSTDADAIFKKIMADEGAGWWMQNVGWLGVRLGAAVSPARRPGSLSTLPRVAGLSLLFLCLALATLAGVSWVVPW